MAIKLSLNNIIIFITSLLPILIGSFFIINSFYNFDLKGVIWLIGLLIASLLGYGLRAGAAANDIKLHPWIREGRAAKKDELPTHDFCEIFEPLGEAGKLTRAIDSHALFHGFTFVYLLFGNQINALRPGTGFLIIYLILIIIDFAYRLIKGCANAEFGIVGGVLVGALAGFGWFYLIISAFQDGRELVFFGLDPSAKKCKISTLRNKTFKCAQTPIGNK